VRRYDAGAPTPQTPEPEPLRIPSPLSWKHTGFSVRGETRLGPTDREAIETVARYMVRCPTSLTRLVWHDGAPKVLYREHDTEIAEEIDACNFVARVLTHVPDPRRHSVHCYRGYSNTSRGKRRKGAAGLQPATDEPEELSPAQRERRRGDVPDHGVSRGPDPEGPFC
jgi:hypothetical protein